MKKDILISQNTTNHIGQWISVRQSQDLDAKPPGFCFLEKKEKKKKRIK